MRGRYTDRRSTRFTQELIPEEFDMSLFHDILQHLKYALFLLCPSFLILVNIFCFPVETSLKHCDAQCETLNSISENISFCVTLLANFFY